MFSDFFEHPEGAAASLHSYLLSFYMVSLVIFVFLRYGLVQTMLWLAVTHCFNSLRKILKSRDRWSD